MSRCGGKIATSPVFERISIGKTRRVGPVCAICVSIAASPARATADEERDVRMRKCDAGAGYMPRRGNSCDLATRGLVLRRKSCAGGLAQEDLRGRSCALRFAEKPARGSARPIRQALQEIVFAM
jgi:hypothetical protein